MKTIRSGVLALAVDFGASDAPMSAEEEGKVPGILQLPTVLGAVAVTYHLPGLQQPLKRSGPGLASIFLEKVTKWNDRAIAAHNPGVRQKLGTLTCGPSNQAVKP